MNVESLPIASLTMHKNNAKLHPQEQIEQIKESIRLYGFNDPIGIWGKKNTIVEGHGRYMAAKEMGMQEVPCIRLDHLTDKQRREYMLVHNQTTMNSGWDFDLLMDELDGLDFDGFDFGFGDCGDTLGAYDDLMEDVDYLSTRGDQDRDTFEVSFAIPSEYRDGVKKYLKDGGKQEVVDFLIKNGGALQGGN